MGKIHLHVTNANHPFTSDEVDIFHHAANEAESFISNAFTFDYEVDIVIATPSRFINTIPEDGIGGRALHSRLILIAVDSLQSRVKEDFIFETICHEMSHSLRWEKLPEYAETLLDAVILEGLAVALEEKKALIETNRSKQQFLTEIKNTDSATIDNIFTHLKKFFHNKNYDHNSAFFTGTDALPRWAGYKLGYYIVKKELASNTQTIEQLTTMSYSSFYNSTSLTETSKRTRL